MLNANILTVDPVVYLDLHFSFGNSSHQAHDIQEFEKSSFYKFPQRNICIQLTLVNHYQTCVRGHWVGTPERYPFFTSIEIKRYFWPAWEMTFFGIYGLTTFFSGFFIDDLFLKEFLLTNCFEIRRGGSLGFLNFQNLALKFSFKLADMQTLQDQNSILFETVKTFEISLFDRYDDQCSKP